MYIDNSGGRYYRGTEQCCRKAPFLILLQCDKRWADKLDNKEEYSPMCPVCHHREECQPVPKETQSSIFKYEEKIRGIVRNVALHQLGHWMMGTARIKGKSITMSGSYGGDGLPTSVEPDIYILGTVLPDELYEAWNTGGGWNSAGTEAPKMAEWAKTLVKK